MINLAVQTFLRSHPLEALKEQYGIRINRHRQYPNLVQLKYDQIESPLREAIAQECRGLILDEEQKLSKRMKVLNSYRI